MSKPEYNSREIGMSKVFIDLTFTIFFRSLRYPRWKGTALYQLVRLGEERIVCPVISFADNNCFNINSVAKS